MSEKDNIEKLIEGKGAQFRNFTIGGIEVRKDDDSGKEKMIVRGYPCVFDNETELYSFKGWDGYTVRVFEKVDPDAFDEANMSDVIFNYNHCGRVYARTRNDSLKLEVRKPTGLEMETELWADDEGHCQFYRDIKRGNIDKMSYCYIPAATEYSVVEDSESEVREYHYVVKKVSRVLDVSAVDIPAYDATEISARRLFDAECAEHEAESKNAASVARAKFNYMMKSRRK